MSRAGRSAKPATDDAALLRRLSIFVEAARGNLTVPSLNAEAEALAGLLGLKRDEPEGDGERFPCSECGESFNVQESGCEEHCPRCCGCEEL